MLVRKWGYPFLFFIMIAIVIICSLSNDAEAAAGQAPIKVFVDGVQITFKVQPRAVKGTTFVELSPLAEALQIKTDEQKGASLVPLRTTSEGAGALVAWDRVNAEINVFTQQMLETLGVTKEKATRIIHEYLGQARNGLQKLNGMYYNMRVDLSGYECGGTCWDFYTFLPDQKIVIGEPDEGGMETIDCAKQTCYSYEIEDGGMKVSNGSKYTVRFSQQGDLVVNDEVLTRVKPIDGVLKLNGKYVNRGYVGLDKQETASSAWEEWLTFYLDGRFQSEYLLLSNKKSTVKKNQGTYRIKGNTISFQYSDGKEKRFLFFVHDGEDGKPNREDVQIGRRNFYVDKE
ncbi:hypothetical protein [Paenibacillus sp. GCM10027626]|uniref:hypothetical protein n=1 Tax=Paenibacillus sp. GCM10027626 TaxID=3273411 RepID=UPI003635D484